MKISHLALRGISGLPDRSYDFTSGGRPHDLIVVTGPEASGKTRLLELVIACLETVGPYEGIVRASKWVAPGKNARVELGVWLDESERTAEGAPGEAPGDARVTIAFGPDGVVADAPRSISRLLSRYDHDPAHGKREYFPETRQPAWGARRDGTTTLEQMIARPSKDPHKYSFIIGFLSTLARDPARERVLSTGLELLSPSVRYTPGKPDDPTRCFSTRGADGAYFSELSSSEANAVIIAATAAMTGLCHSMVFLDRPELHVPPERLVAWVHALAGLGTDNQWIVATSQPRLAEAFAPAQVVSLDPGRVS